MAHVWSIWIAFYCCHGNAAATQRLREAEADLSEPNEHNVTACGRSSASHDCGQRGLLRSHVFITEGMMV